MGRLRRYIAVLAFATVPGIVAAQERTTVSGIVTQASSQQPLVGAQVAIPTQRISVATDANGRFTFSAPRGTHTVRVNLIGYKELTREVTVGATPVSLTFALETDPLRLDELVVIGYGEEKRRNVAGAVTSMKPEAVREAPVASINQVMQGRMPGVQISQNSGTPGAAISVRIRGSSSMQGGNEPLYVVDGVPMNQGDYSAFTQIGFGGQDVDAVSDLSPNDIERIEVLKDASAAAIYGSRASNGVVLITTKRGTIGRPEINFNSYYGVQKDWRRLDLLDADQYIEIYNEGRTARFGPASESGYDAWFGYDAAGKNYWTAVTPGVNTDWLSQVMQEAPISSMEASIRGGIDRVRYFVSGSAMNQDGLIKAMGYERLNGRVNLDYQPYDRLTLGTNVSLARSVNRRARADNTIYSAWSNSLANPPIEPVFNDDGSYYDTWYLNPVAMNNEAEAEERNIRILGNAFAVYSLMEGVNLRASVGLDQIANRSNSYDSPVFGPWAAQGGAAEAATRFVNKLTYEGTLSFNRAFGANHDFSGVVGTSYETNSDSRSAVQGQNFPTEYFKYITSAALITSGTSSASDWALFSYFGRLSYTFDERITTTFNIRRDGSSRFGENNRFGTFPSASVMWRLGEESFMQDQEIVRNLAVRASYGITGNQQELGNFASRGLFGGGSNYNEEPGIAPSQLANPDLRWEKTKQMNVGADFSILSDRLSFNFDYYNKVTDDLLIQQPVPRTTGFTSIWSNVGAMENKGFEIATTANLLQNWNGLTWTANLSIAHNRNKVTQLYNDQPFMSGFVNRVEEGEELGYYYGYVTDGIFKTMDEVRAHATQTEHSDPRRATAPGDIRFKDLNNDGVINDEDQTKIGSPWPDYEGGLTNTLSFKGFDLTAFVQFSQGNQIYNANRIYMDQFGSGRDNHTTRAMDRWTPENPNATEPRAIWGDPNLNTRDSDRFVEDGSYVRLKNLVLGYTLPGSFAERVGFRSARVYVQGQNLFTRTDYTGFDPEVHYGGQTAISRGTDFYTMPQARTITVGFNVGF